MTVALLGRGYVSDPEIACRAGRHDKLNQQRRRIQRIEIAYANDGGATIVWLRAATAIEGRTR